MADKTFTSEEASTASTQLDNLFKGVANYFRDAYKTPGYFLEDICKPEQFVYGKAPDDKDDKPYLVDLDPALEPYSNARDHQGAVTARMDFLYQTIKLMEQKLGGQLLKHARSAIYEYTKEVDPSERDLVQWVFRDVIAEIKGQPK